MHLQLLTPYPHYQNNWKRQKAAPHLSQGFYSSLPPWESGERQLTPPQIPLQADACPVLQLPAGRKLPQSQGCLHHLLPCLVTKEFKAR